MIRIKPKRILSLVTLCIILALFSGVAAPIEALRLGLAGVTSNFGSDPMTERSFTWHTDAGMEAGAVAYCSKDSFKGFEQGNIQRVRSSGILTKTDLDLRRVHKATLTGLTPGKEYVYRIEDGQGAVLAQGAFQTADKDPGSFTFLHITDSQGVSAKDYAVWKSTLDQALNKFPGSRFLIHTGDIVDQGYKITQWDLFTNAVKDRFLSLPIEPAVGNHDAMNTNKTNIDDKNFRERFNLPEVKDTGAPAGTVYSFDYGNAHIAVMNTQCGSKNLKKQAEWLEKDLKSTSKTWKIVALHRGAYGATYDSTDIRNAWTPVFDRYHVDLVLQGHDHNYVRSYPMKNKVKVEAGEGTVYVTANSGGVKFYPLKSRSWQAVDLQPKTQMYLAVTVKKTTLSVEAYDIKNTLQDAFSLVK